MAAGSTYTPIATTTLGSNQSSITFNSFSGYTDLVLVTNVKTTTSGRDLLLQFNGDTGTNYSRTFLTGDGSTASSGRTTNYSSILMDYWGFADTGFVQMNITHIMNYSNSTTYKTTLSRASNANSGTDATVGLWRSTAAITSMTISAISSGVFATGSTFTLYGIASA